ncbi:hypothetical protein [Symbiopectobacterium sp. RP]|uniref:hypothetical protein n=1 Tax=Symbiopectobacterium sp. RP TaxID=3248553 RepID=UPI003D290AD9
MGTSKKQKKREWLRYRDFVLSPYVVIKIKSLVYRTTLGDVIEIFCLARFHVNIRLYQTCQ